MITVISTTQGDGHGAEAVLCELLSAWPADGLPLQIAAPQGSRVLACAGERGLALLPLSDGRDALIQNVRSIHKALCGGHDMSLVHAWSARAFEFAWFLKRWRGMPASGTLHDHPCARFHGGIRQRIIGYCANHMDALAVVSEAVSSACKAEQWQVPVTVIRNGLSECPPEPVESASQRLRIGLLGMYTHWKGAGIVADWIGRQGRQDGVVWKLYGAPSLSLQALFQPLANRWPDRVSIEGRKTTAEIFSQIDVLVHASTQFDPLPTVLIEAARAGIPCVASCLGGAAEIVNDGVTGFLFDPVQPASGWDALNRLIADAPLRCAMRAYARKHYEQNFRADRMVADYEAFWKHLLARSAGKE